MTLVEKYNKLKKAFSNLKAKYKTVKAALHLAIDSNAKLVYKLHIAAVKLHISHDMIITLNNNLDSAYGELKTQHEILCKLDKENSELQNRLYNKDVNDNDNDIMITTFRFNDGNSNELYTIPTTRQGVDILGSFTTKARTVIDKIKKDYKDLEASNKDLEHENAVLNSIIDANGGLDKLKSIASNKHCGANSQPDTDLRYTTDGCCSPTNKYKSNNVPTVLSGLVGLLVLGVMVELMILLVK